MSNPRSAAEWILLRERAASAGFNLKAVAAADFEAALTSGNFEVFIGARPIVSLPSENLFSLTTGSFVGYKNKAVQAALTEFSAAKDEQGRGAALKEIDAQLVADAYGMPLYEVASLVLFTDRIEGFAVAPMADSVTWGYQNWSIKPKS
jgi:peptide/nickel transport system substrate-binding protein